MREIKLKGKAAMTLDELNENGFSKSLHNNGWFEGNLIVSGKNLYIVGKLIEVYDDFMLHEFWVEINPKTLREYTGHKDANEKEVYEGDIIMLEYQKKSVAKIFWNKEMSGFYYKYFNEGQEYKFTKGAATHFVVIGNTYDNPELLDE